MFAKKELKLMELKSMVKNRERSNTYRIISIVVKKTDREEEINGVSVYRKPEVFCCVKNASYNICGITLN